jgi:hypothetical protein
MKIIKVILFLVIIVLVFVLPKLHIVGRLILIILSFATWIGSIVFEWKFWLQEKKSWLADSFVVIGSVFAGVVFWQILIFSQDNSVLSWIVPTIIATSLAVPIFVIRKAISSFSGSSTTEYTT